MEPGLRRQCARAISQGSANIKSTLEISDFWEPALNTMRLEVALQVKNESLAARGRWVTLQSPERTLVIYGQPFPLSIVYPLYSTFADFGSQYRRPWDRFQSLNGSALRGSWTLKANGSMNDIISLWWCIHAPIWATTPLETVQTIVFEPSAITWKYIYAVDASTATWMRTLAVNVTVSSDYGQLVGEYYDQCDRWIALPGNVTRSDYVQFESFAEVRFHFGSWINARRFRFLIQRGELPDLPQGAAQVVAFGHHVSPPDSSGCPSTSSWTQSSTTSQTSETSSTLTATR